jgi:hypothetical protein
MNSNAGESPGVRSLRELLRESAFWHYSECMFFRREKPHELTFTERIDGLRKLGFSTSPAGSGKAQIIRDGIGAIIEDRGAGEHPRVNKAGLVLGDEIGLLVNRGFQMFWKSPTGRTAPALATQLKALHAFEEDLKEGLGLTSLYNESLGTTSDLHLYDRVQHRDQGDADKPWEHKAVTS